MVNFITVSSFILLILFLTSYVGKLLVLYKKFGINALVLAKGNKGKFIDLTESFVRVTTFVWGLMWGVESLLSNWISGWLPNFFSIELVNYIGLLMMAVGLSFFVLSMIWMKKSWRVGIDKNTKTKLITNGIYKYSRNPAFVGFNLMFMGLFLTFPNIATLSVWILNAFSIHILILHEEKHLENVFQEQYQMYKNKTPRYIIF